MSQPSVSSPPGAGELEQIARRYIEALLAADDSRVPLSPDVRRAHLIIHGAGPHVWQIAHGADVVRRDIRNEQLLSCSNLRIMVDGERSTVVALWESSMNSNFARAITIMDRFVIADGAISELEIISIPQGTPFEHVPYPG